MFWYEAVRNCSENLEEPFELEFVWRNLHELDKLQWVTLQREDISKADLSALTDISKALENHTPPQYIVGWAEFFNLKFKVDERVLIPRPETEELVQMILDEHSNEQRSVLDIGTGSGTIAISLKNARSNWQLTASDISEKALELAAENAEQLGQEIDFIQSNVFENIQGKFDIIVSNPPYISNEDIAEVDLSVHQYEPQNALYAEDEGYAIYQAIADFAADYLKPSGQLYFEIGYKQGERIKQMFEKAFADKKVQIHQDYYGKDRMVSVK